LRPLRLCLDTSVPLATPPIDSDEAVAIANSADTRTKSPTLDPDVMKTCIAGWIWQQIKPVDALDTNPKEQVQKRRNSPPPEDLLASELAEELQGKVIYDDSTSRWLCYERGVWHKASEAEMQALISTEVRSRAISGYGTSAYIQNILFHLRPLLFVKEWEEKPSSERLPFLNGVLDIPTMELLPHSPGHYLTWTLPRNYEPDASDWGLIKSWLDESLKGKQDDIWKVLCFFAAIIRGRTDIQRFLECRGAGGSGKSTLANLATKLVGDRNMIPMSWRSITNDYKMADFKGKRLAVFADAGVANADQMEVFRAMTGEDKLSGRPIRESWIEFYSSALCIVTANKPIFSGQGHSWYGRRAVVLKFDNYVEKPRNLMKEFEPQISAFLNYLLTISDEDITLTFEKKRGVSLHAWESMVESDSVAAWINDCIKREPGYMSTIGAKPGELDAIKSGALASNFETLTLYAHYVWYCRENGLMARSKNTFSSAVLDQCNQVLGWREVQKTTNKANSRVMVGIRLRSPEDLRLSDSLTQAASLETSLTS